MTAIAVVAHNVWTTIKLSLTMFRKHMGSTISSDSGLQSTSSPTSNYGVSGYNEKATRTTWYSQMARARACTISHLRPDAHDVIHLLDVAGSLGFGGCVERGPGRHAMGGGALFVYLRDPDGHRVEFFNTHYQAIDVEPPLRFDLSDPKRTDLWGMPAVERWFYEASEFVGCSTHPPTIDAKPRTLRPYCRNALPKIKLQRTEGWRFATD